MLAHSVYVPLPIPAGSRISARCQSTAGSSSLVIGGTLVRGRLPYMMRSSQAVTYGAVTADSGGTLIDPGAVANTKGLYSVLSAATTAPIRYAIVCIGNEAFGVRTDANNRYDIAVGADGAETIIVPDVFVRAEENIDMVHPHLSNRMISVPTGQRLVARSASAITDAQDRTFDMAIIGFN